jgi:hypothetical protein
MILHSYKENLVGLAVSYTVPAGSWEVTVSFQFVSEYAAYKINSCFMWYPGELQWPTMVITL